MQSKKENPFDECPIYKTEQFIFKRVCEDDAEDLFICYSDPITLKHMNNDNCKGEWRSASADELKNAWQKPYEQRAFLRWSVKDKNIEKVVGTIEIAPLPFNKPFFGKETPVGILRIDILSNYEKEAVFIEISELMASELANGFQVNQVIIKASPDELEKVNELIKNQFIPYSLTGFPYKYYYMRSIPIV